MAEPAKAAPKPERPRVRKTLAPCRPSPALEVEFKRRLFAELDEMHNSVMYWLRAAYRQNPPALAELVAMDAKTPPAKKLRIVIKRLSNRWQKRISETAPKLATYFATAVNRRSEASLRQTLRTGGFSVKFQPGQAATTDVVQSIIQENVALIRSIPEQYFTQIEGMVMRSVSTGRDLETLTKDLQRQFGVTRRRATLIARDQNNKATAAIHRVRQLELGIEEAIWMHSGGGKEPRPSHVKAGKKQVRFSLKTGWFDPDERQWILPGQLINCRCVARPVVPGF